MNLIKTTNRKKSFIKLSEQLWRNAHGDVCTPAGVCSRADYERVVNENRDVNFPEYLDLPVRA